MLLVCDHIMSYHVHPPVASTRSPVSTDLDRLYVSYIVEGIMVRLAMKQLSAYRCLRALHVFDIINGRPLWMFPERCSERVVDASHA